MKDELRGCEIHPHTNLNTTCTEYKYFYLWVNWSVHINLGYWTVRIELKGGVRDNLKQKTFFSMIFYGDTA